MSSPVLSRPLPRVYHVRLVKSVRPHRVRRCSSSFDRTEPLGSSFFKNRAIDRHRAFGREKSLSWRKSNILPLSEANLPFSVAIRDGQIRPEADLAGTCPATVRRVEVGWAHT